MKKTGLLLLIGFISVCLIGGCTTTRTANLKMNPDGGVSYDDRSIPVIQSPPGPVAVATGAAIIRRANSEQEFNQALAGILKARAENIRNSIPSQDGAPGSSKEFVLVVINDALDKELNFDDPELKKVYTVSIGERQYFSAEKMPKKINYWWSGEKRKRIAKVKKETDKYDGVPVDSVIRIRR